MTSAAPPKETFIKFIAYLQVIGIILVVFGHSFHEYPDGSNGTSLLIFRLCYNFRMPLFMFVSGFLMMHTEFMKGKVPSVRRFGLVKIKRLLIPYFTLTLLTYFPRATMSGLADEQVELSASGLLKALYITDLLPIPYFWFLQASFILLISSYTVLALCRRLRLPDSVALGSLIVIAMVMECMDWPGTEIFGYKKAIAFGIFFISGAVYCRYHSLLDTRLPLDTFPALGVSFALWLTTFLLWEGTPYVMVASFFGIAMCICAAKLMVKHNVTLIDHLIGANYIIFLLSWYLNVATQQVLSHYVTLPWQIHTLLSLTFGIYVPWLAYRYLRSHQHIRLVRLISFLLGQSFRRNRTPCALHTLYQCMREWVFTTKPASFRMDEALVPGETIDWPTFGRFKIEAGDLVYFYASSPVLQMIGKCEIERIDLPFDEADPRNDLRRWPKRFSRYPWMRMRVLQTAPVPFKPLQRGALYYHTEFKPSPYPKLLHDSERDYVNRAFDEAMTFRASMVKYPDGIDPEALSRVEGGETLRRAVDALKGGSVSDVSFTSGSPSQLRVTIAGPDDARLTLMFTDIRRLRWDSDSTAASFSGLRLEREDIYLLCTLDGIEAEILASAMRID